MNCFVLPGHWWGRAGSITIRPMHANNRQLQHEYCHSLIQLYFMLMCETEHIHVNIYITHNHDNIDKLTTR